MKSKTKLPLKSLRAFINKNSRRLKLSQSQETAVDELDRFIKGWDRCFVLKGYAGTGKTFLVKSLAEYLQHTAWTVNLMAPTGRAAEVLQQRTAIQAKTIHKAIYNTDLLNEVEHKHEGESYKWYFGERKLDKDQTKVVIIVDESSMISNSFSTSEFIHFGSGHLLQDLIKYSLIQSASPAVLTKIIFIGDPAQLPPIIQNKKGEDQDTCGIPPALDLMFLKEKFPPLAPVSTELKDVVRHSGGIGDNATWIRSKIAVNDYSRFRIDVSRPDVESLSPLNLAKTFWKRFKSTNLSSVITIVYSNRQAELYNRIIREHKFKRKNPELQVGDVLLVNANNPLYQLTNGTFASVVEIKRFEKKNLRCGWYDIKTKQRNFDNFDFEFADIVIEHQMGEIPKRTECKALLNVLKSDTASIDRLERIALYQYVVDEYKKYNAVPGTAKLEDCLKSDPYFNAVHFKYGYAVTCHKAQGGEWSTVIADLSRFTGHSHIFFFQWAYTAITRAKKKLYVMNAPVVTPLSGIRPSRAVRAITPPTSSTGIVPAAKPVSKRLTSSLPAKELDLDEDLLGLTDQRQVTDFVLGRIEKKFGIHYEFLELVPERHLLYSFSRGDETGKLLFHFNDKGSFTTVEPRKVPPTKLDMEIIKIIEKIAAPVPEITPESEHGSITGKLTEPFTQI